MAKFNQRLCDLYGEDRYLDMLASTHSKKVKTKSFSEKLFDSMLYDVNNESKIDLSNAEEATKQELQRIKK